MYVVNNKISSLVGNVNEFKQNIGKINSHGVDLSAMWIQISQIGAIS